jgi:hypothetical protein
MKWRTIISEGYSHTESRCRDYRRKRGFYHRAHFGFDTGVRSFPYVALWAKDKKTLEANLAAIRKVSAKIIEALEAQVKKPAGAGV